MQPEILKVPAMIVVGMETKFIPVMCKDHNAQQKIPQLWMSFNSLEDEIPNRVPGRSFGLCEEVTPNKECLYTACVEVSTDTVAPAGMVTKKLVGGNYAS